MIKARVKNLVCSKPFQIAASTATVLTATIVPFFASAEDTAPDISTTMSTAMQSTVNQTLQCLAAIAPVAVTIFTFVFVAQKAIQFFRRTTK